MGLNFIKTSPKSASKRSISSKSKKKIKSIISFERLREIIKSVMAFNYNNLGNIRPRRHDLLAAKELQSWGNTDYHKTIKSFNDMSKKGNLHESVTFKQKRWSKITNLNDNMPENATCFNKNGCNINMKQYLTQCTLHGFRYIGDSRLSMLERVFWFMSVFIAVIMAAYFIGNIYERWNMSPMIVSLNPEPAQITTIPFPAITICNMNIVKKSVAEKILSGSDEDNKKLLQGLCNIFNDSIDVSSSKAGEWVYFKKFLIEVAQPCHQLLASCRWKGESKDCESLFNAALTDEGLCCTFNSVHREIMFRNPKEISDLNITFPFPAVDWSPENGYPSDAPLNGFPWRPIGTGAHLGLTLVLDAAIDEYYCSSTSGVGFKILLHNPLETPKIADFGNFLPPGKEIRVEVRPRIYDAQPQLRNIAINKRGCYFSNERDLVYFRAYTQKNCAMECEARLTIEKCNCSQYFMPKNSSIRICGISDAKCYLELKVAIEDRLGVNESASFLKSNCDDCLPACYELSYGKEQSSTQLTDKFALLEDIYVGRPPPYFVENMAIVHIYFVDTSFIRFTKGELFGFTDFLSNTGGLLGLFMGFSFLSLVEILYFLSLRVVCALYRQQHPKVSTVYPFSQ